MNTANNALDLIGRILVALFFVPAGIEKITGYTGTATFMAAKGVPGELLPLVILTEIGCGLAILLGWHTRVTAFLLGGFTFLTVIFFHFNAANGFHQTTITIAEAVVGGGLWILAAHGAGGWSLDAVRGRTQLAPAHP